MIAGDHGLIKTLRGMIGDDRLGLMMVKYGRKEYFFCFFFSDHERGAGVIFFCVAYHFLFAIAMSGGGHDAAMPIADDLPVLKGHKRDKAYHGDELAHQRRRILSEN